ncbi:unnamed protein product [Protopolystoma xenopodis]|uniref:Uncharacterized protein n=1 Tax=Protopolystoma xenopodis TaxID=117903 RepID=A0A448X8K8_9PLAT|nr:unnamed protein product [Protopolystoma xenopodis]
MSFWMTGFFNPQASRYSHSLFAASKITSLVASSVCVLTQTWASHAFQFASHRNTTFSRQDSANVCPTVTDVKLVRKRLFVLVYHLEGSNNWLETIGQLAFGVKRGLLSWTNEYSLSCEEWLQQESRLYELVHRSAPATKPEGWVSGCHSSQCPHRPAILVCLGLLVC